MAANKRKARPVGLVEHCSQSGGPFGPTLRARSILGLRASERFENDRHFLHLFSCSVTRVSLHNHYPDWDSTLEHRLARMRLAIDIGFHGRDMAKMVPKGQNANSAVETTAL